jgi:hypothetical protein
VGKKSPSYAAYFGIPYYFLPNNSAVGSVVFSWKIRRTFTTDGVLLDGHPRLLSYLKESQALEARWRKPPDIESVTGPDGGCVQTPPRISRSFLNDLQPRSTRLSRTKIYVISLGFP